MEKLLQKGYEVLFLTEAVDEYMMTHLTEFDDKKFQDASKDDVKLGKDDKKAFKALKVAPMVPAPSAEVYLLSMHADLTTLQGARSGPLLCLLHGDWNVPHEKTW